MGEQAPRPLTARERSVLDLLLSVDLEGADRLRLQAADATVVGGCDCGCPSIDFTRSSGEGISPQVDALVDGTPDSLFLYSRGNDLGGIEYVSGGDVLPAELPHPSVLRIY